MSLGSLLSTVLMLISYAYAPSRPASSSLVPGGGRSGSTRGSGLLIVGRRPAEPGPWTGSGRARFRFERLSQMRLNRSTMWSEWVVWVMKTCSMSAMEMPAWKRVRTVPYPASTR
ncbi:MAG: hypothetical protein QOE32_3225 [Pseudonocardiales bacterium]|nr:hypothetical protein [Pseudonocardiales bacterium]